MSGISGFSEATVGLGEATVGLGEATVGLGIGLGSILNRLGKLYIADHTHLALLICYFIVQMLNVLPKALLVNLDILPKV